MYGFIALIAMHGFMLKVLQDPSQFNLQLPAATQQTADPQTVSLGRLQVLLKKSWQNLNLNCSNTTISYPDFGCSRKFQNAILAPNTNQTNYTSITLATHGGVSKLDRVLTQARWWGGPVSAAVYLNRVEDIEALVVFVSLHRQGFVNVTLHILMETAEADGYPHNILRNLVLDSVVTDYVLTMDVDFITNPGAHDKMLDLIEHDSAVYDKLRSKYMFALPPFDILPRPGEEAATDDLVPSTKEEVLQRVENGTIARFYENTNPGSDMFHSYNEWYRGNSFANFIPSDYRRCMEPYVLARREGLPPYHEEFRGYGNNKESWFWRLGEIEKYRFGVLLDFYVSHVHHPKVTGSRKSAGEQRNQPIYAKYQKDLKDGTLQKQEVSRAR
jgi:hypothetical protein